MGNIGGEDILLGKLSESISSLMISEKGCELVTKSLWVGICRIWRH